MPKEIGIYCKHKFQSNLQPMRHHSSILTNGLKTSITALIGFLRSKTPKNVHISLFKMSLKLTASHLTPSKNRPCRRQFRRTAGAIAALQGPITSQLKRAVTIRTFAIFVVLFRSKRTSGKLTRKLFCISNPYRKTPLGLFRKAAGIRQT